jgi:hypothetical protein
MRHILEYILEAAQFSGVMCERHLYVFLIMIALARKSNEAQLLGAP